jgi:hypothetical protein
VNGTAPKPANLPHGKVDQVNKQFVPQVTIVPTGTSVDFPNSDNIRHSLYSFSPPKSGGIENVAVSLDSTGLPR